MGEQFDKNYIIVTKSKKVDYITSDGFSTDGKVVGSINTAIQGEFSDKRKFKIILPKDTKEGEDYKITQFSIEGKQYKLMNEDKESSFIIKRNAKTWDNNARHTVEDFVNNKGKLHLEPLPDGIPEIKPSKRQDGILKAALEKGLSEPFESAHNNLPSANTGEKTTGRA